MIKIEEKELKNIKLDIIKYLEKNFNKNKNLNKIIELALTTYENEIIKHNINRNNTISNK